jgi:hypothetical protein
VVGDAGSLRAGDGDHLVLIGELAWGPPISMEEGVMAQCAAMARVLLDAFGYAVGGEGDRGGVLPPLGEVGVLLADPSELRWGLKLHRAKALPGHAGAGNVDTPRCRLPC